MIEPNAPVQRGEVIGLLASCDTLIYQTAVAGCVWAGLTVCIHTLLETCTDVYKVFPISPRNPPDAIAHLLRTVSARRVLTTQAPFTSLIAAVAVEMAKGGVEVDFVELPSLTDIYPCLGLEDASAVPEPVQLPRRNTFYKDAELYMHSSGSTGMPKSIPYSSEFLAKLQYMGESI
jgi:non-ribosomal peptide synthetase component F